MYYIYRHPTSSSKHDRLETGEWVAGALRLRHVGVLSQFSSVKELFTSELANSSSLGFQHSGGRDGRENCLFL